MATVQLLVGNERNRELLAGAVGDEHEVVAGADGAAAVLADDVDLCVLDAAALRRHAAALAERKADAEPVFLPYLLVLGDRDPDSVTGEVWDRVDEVIAAPVDRTELDNRVENLLERRALSLELEERRAVSERRFRTLFEAAPDPTLVADDEGTVTAANEAFTRLVDAERSAVVGADVADLGGLPVETVRRHLVDGGDGDGDGDGDGGGEGADEEGDHARENREGAEPPVDPVVCVDRDGETRVTELNVSHVDRDGIAGGREREVAEERIGVFRDVTEREAREAELQRQVEQLERFAGIVSHDLRDPLNTAQAKVRLLRAEYDDERLADLEGVHERMAALVEDVLELARQGQAIGDTEAVSLDPAVTAAWDTVDPPDAATVTREDLPAVEADPERLQALLENLLRNSVEHAGASVAVTVGPLDDGQGFYVADDGPGVPEQDRERVFEYGHTGAEEGTGMGLAIVAQVAEAHGWDVAVTESESGGARFEVRGVSVQ